MAVPQNKISKSRRNQRRSHDSLSGANPNDCPSCGEQKRPHHICPSCGTYADREVIAIATEVDLDEDAA
ncbi:MAG: 50S ribosomal protein L32 [Rhodobacteraceae bacterium]|nr:50S ribosomal protein L32 [Paracoccaceae bacterium]